MSAPLRLVGKYTGPDVAIVQKLTGQTLYGFDYNRPNQAYMEILKSTEAFAKITSVDASKALAMKGVLAVITPEDIKDNPYRMAGPTRMILPYDAVHYAGEEVVALAADDPYVAEEALTQIKVTYSPLKFILDPEEAMKAGAPELYSGGNIVRAGPTATFAFGDTAKGFAASDRTIEGRYETETVQHDNLDPWAALIEWRDGRLHIWTDSQYMYGMRSGVATALGIPISSVVVYSQQAVGGGFGDKTGGTRPLILGAMLSKKIGRPVKFRYSREEQLLNAGHRWKAIFYIKMGVKNDGTVMAMEERIIGDAGGFYYTGSSGNALETYGIYKFPNFKIECYDAYTNHGYQAPYRCVADPAGCFAIESMMTNVAMQLGMDPLEFRKKNDMYVQGDADQLSGNRIPSIGQPGCIDKAKELSGWSTKYKPFVKGSKPTGVVHGIGVANHCCGHGAGSYPNAAVIVMAGDGSALVHTGAQDIGNSRTTQLTLIVAEHLGLPLERVHVVNTSTDAGPDSGGTFGSRQTKSGGNACGLAALDVKDQLLDRAATTLGVTKDKLTYALDGSMKITVTADPTKSATIAQLCATQPQIIGRGQWPPPARTTQRTYGTHVAEVDVDTDTGKVKVTKFVAIHDIGRVIYPPAAEAQIHGGVVQCIGYGLQESLLVDKPTGKPYMASILDHKMPVFNECPEIVAGFVEYPEQAPDSYNHGAKGLGEPPTSPPSAAINGAIANAIGVVFPYIPITPEMILKALGKA